MQGRVELCNNNQWGTVCDNSWGNPDAQVVCAQLGYSRSGKKASQTSEISYFNIPVRTCVALVSTKLCFTGASGQCCAAYGQGSGSILLADAQCIGNESRLLDCSYVSIGSFNCIHGEDAGVTCTTSKYT